MSVRLECEVEIKASDAPENSFKGWDHVPASTDVVEILADIDYVPYCEEQGGTWDEVLATGGYLEHVWIAEEDVLRVLSSDQKRELEQWCENKIREDF